MTGSRFSGAYIELRFFMQEKGTAVQFPFLLFLSPLARFSVRIPQGVTSPRCLRLIAAKLTDALGSPFFQRPSRHQLHRCFARPIAKRLADSKKLLYKYLFAINNVDTTLGNLLKLAAIEVVDAFDSLAVGNNVLNACSVCAVECREYHTV